MTTRRSESRLARADAIGTPRATPTMASQPRLRSDVKKRSPVNGMSATSGRMAQNTPKPTSVPATAATPDSMEAIAPTCAGVAPTRRRAAKRSSRRAAARRVAVATKIRIGIIRPTAPRPRMTRMKSE